MISQPHVMATGPPLFHAWPNVVKQPAKIEMIIADVIRELQASHDVEAVGIGAGQQSRVDAS